MLDQICAHIHNYFEVNALTGRKMIHSGTFTIENGGISLPFLADGQYFRIVNSQLNDGVYQYPADGLRDEVFTGVIWEMRPPADFLRLVAEIEAWAEKYGEASKNPYTSENVIGVYSYSKASGAATWEQIFKDRLKPYRKLY